MGFVEEKAKQLIAEVGQVLKGLPTEQLDAVITDFKKFLEENKEDLNRWVGQYMAGETSKKEFIWFLRSKKNLLELKTLEHLGLSLVKLEKTRDKVIKTLKNAVLGGLGELLRRLVKLKRR